MELDIISCRILYAEIFIKIRILLYEFPCKIVYKYLYECYQILCVFISKFVVGECNKCI